MFELMRQAMAFMDGAFGTKRAENPSAVEAWVTVANDFRLEPTRLHDVARHIAAECERFPTPAQFCAHALELGCGKPRTAPRPYDGWLELEQRDRELILAPPDWVEPGVGPCGRPLVRYELDASVERQRLAHSRDDVLAFRERMNRIRATLQSPRSAQMEREFERTLAELESDPFAE